MADGTPATFPLWAGQACAQLDAAIRGAQAAIDGAWFLDAVVEAGLRSSLVRYATMRVQLGPYGLDGQALVRGELSPARYTEKVNLAGWGLAGVQRDASDASASLSRFWAEVVVPTAADLKAGTVAVAQATPGMLWAVAVGLVALVALKVLR